MAEGSDGHRWALRSMAMGDTGSDTDLLRTLEDLVEGSQAWEITGRYRLVRYRHSDAERQTAEVEVMFNLNDGWGIVATEVIRRPANCWPIEWYLPAMETTPTALMVRWISTGAPALSWVQEGRAGGGPAGRPP